MESLPAVVVQVQGALTVAGNLPAFGQALRLQACAPNAKA